MLTETFFLAEFFAEYLYRRGVLLASRWRRAALNSPSELGAARCSACHCN
jgi:hypothetical protein